VATHNNIRRVSFESFYSFVNFPLIRTVTAILNYHSSVISLVSTASNNKNRITDSCSSLVHSVSGQVIIITALKIMKTNRMQMSEVRLNVVYIRHVLQGCQYHFQGKIKFTLILYFPHTYVCNK
jgi:hypothetical protein